MGSGNLTNQEWHNLNDNATQQKEDGQTKALLAKWAAGNDVHSPLDAEVFEKEIIRYVDHEIVTYVWRSSLYWMVQVLDYEALVLEGHSGFMKNPQVLQDLLDTIEETGSGEGNQ